MTKCLSNLSLLENLLGFFCLADILALSKATARIKSDKLIQKAIKNVLKERIKEVEIILLIFKLIN